jgi:4-oxalocrotonate tautomerase
MPLIEVKVIEGVFSHKQKQEMITKLTDAMVSIEGENLRGHTLVLVEEVKSGDWAVGGKSLSTADVRAVVAGKSPGQPRAEPAEEPELVGSSGSGRKR